MASGSGLLSLSCLQVCPFFPRASHRVSICCWVHSSTRRQAKSCQQEGKNSKVTQQNRNLGCGGQSEHTFHSDWLLESDLFRYTVFHPRSIITKCYHKKIKPQLFPLKKSIFGKSHKICLEFFSLAHFSSYFNYLSIYYYVSIFLLIYGGYQFSPSPTSLVLT